MVESIIQQFSLRFPDPEFSGKQSTSADALVARINDFICDLDSGVTFDAWFKRWEDVYRVEFAIFGIKKHDRYTEMLLPKNPRDLKFDKTVKQLSAFFGEKSLLFNIRYQCLKLVKKDTDNFLTFASIGDRDFEKFKL
ncbi:unnamed protein product [Schistocephalus solidus]|uniref:Uncharacterized protein n=1 Tax=Schistocephalus solidus TaxID=70667 RepID=A0A183SP31_SCHSO|nr:unnamed protein product [Schistocephalus solidus]